MNAHSEEKHKEFKNDLGYSLSVFEIYKALNKDESTEDYNKDETRKIQLDYDLINLRCHIPYLEIIRHFRIFLN